MASGAHNGNFSYTQRQCDECEMSSKRPPTCKFDAFVSVGFVRDLHFSWLVGNVWAWEVVAMDGYWLVGFKGEELITS